MFVLAVLYSYMFLKTVQGSTEMNFIGRLFRNEIASYLVVSGRSEYRDKNWFWPMAGIAGVQSNS